MILGPPFRHVQCPSQVRKPIRISRKSNFVLSMDIFGESHSCKAEHELGCHVEYNFVLGQIGKPNIESCLDCALGNSYVYWG